MNLYSRARKHIDMSRVKQIHEEKKSYNLLIDYKKKQKLSELRDKHSPEFSNWRGTVTEGMNTGNVFFTTLPSTGEVDLETIPTQTSGSFEGVGSNSALENTVVKGSGSGTGSEGGFNIGNHLAFQGDGQPRWAILKPIDSSKFDTISIKAIRGNDNNGGEDPEAPGEQLRLYYLPPGGNSFRSISVNPSGEQVHGPDTDVIIPLGSTSDGLRNWEIALPSYARGAAFRYMLYQLTNDGASFDHYGITQINYKRRAPISVFVSLDSPEAVSFISDGSGNMTPAEKKKRLEDMLSASDEYQSRQFPFNKAAYEKAAKDVARNIQISLDPDTFKFPEYGTPEYNQIYNPRLEADSNIEQIKNSLESKGLTLDTLKKDFSPNGSFRSLGREGTLILLNNPETQEKAFNAMGIDLNLIKNLTDDTYSKLYKKTYFTPGGTPSTGWDGKMYEINSPELEKSRIVPLETYLEAKKRDGYYGAERPDVAPPGTRYVMEKKYSFSSDDDATPKFTGPQNETFEQQSKTAEYNIRKVGDSSLGFRWDLGHFERGLGSGNQRLEAGTGFARAQVIDSMTAVLNHMYNSRDSLAFAYANDARHSNSKIDMTAEYDPLYHLLKYDDGKRALQIASSSSASQLYYPLSSFGGTNREQSKLYNDREQDRRIANFKKAYDRIKSMSTDFASYDNDAWYVERQNVTIGSPTKAHPYANVNMTQPTDPTSPDDPFMDIQVGDERIVKRGDETVLDTMKGIDDKQKTDPTQPDPTDPTQPDPTGPLGIDDFNSVADFSAYKAGGGDAAVKSGKTVANVISQGKKNLDAFNGGSPQPSDPDNQKLSDEITNLKNNKVKDPAKETPNLLIRLVKLITGADDSILADAIKIAGETIAPVVDAASKIEVGGISVSDAIPPLYKYGSDIAKSMLSGEPVNLTKDDLSSNDINLFLKNSNLDNVKITKTPVPYADDHIRELPDGTVVINKTGENNTIPIFDPPIVKVQRPFSDVLRLPAGAPVAADLGFSNPIGAAGQAQVQLIVPDNNPQNAYLKYTDHAYYNDDSDDPGEAAGKDALADAVNSIAPGLGPGYKSNLKGDRILKFDVPYNDLLPKQQKLVDDEIADRELGKGSLSDTLRNIGATDTATLAPKRKKKKVVEMYEPKAKHNDKVAKVTGRLKTVSDFLNNPDVKPVFPKDPPPEMINGRHPDLVDGEKISNRFNKLDPTSAKSMPKTGNPKIDAKVAKALKRPK